MNIRVVGVILLVVLFASASTMLSLSISGGLPLNEAYAAGNINVIQKTDAGTIPHQVEIKNNGNSTISVKKGNILSSSITQDLVIAEDKQINPNSTEVVYAFGLKPSQRAVVGAKLLPVNNTYFAVNQILSNSGGSDADTAYKNQLKIWIIMSGGNFNIYTGEPVSVVEKKQIKWTQFRQNVADAKQDLLNTFKVSESEVPNLNQNQKIGPQKWIDNQLSWIKSSLGLS